MKAIHPIVQSVLSIWSLNKWTYYSIKIFYWIISKKTTFLDSCSFENGTGGISWKKKWMELKSRYSKVKSDLWKEIDHWLMVSKRESYPEMKLLQKIWDKFWLHWKHSDLEVRFPNTTPYWKLNKSYVMLAKFEILLGDKVINFLAELQDLKFSLLKRKYSSRALGDMGDKCIYLRIFWLETFEKFSFESNLMEISRNVIFHQWWLSFICALAFMHLESWILIVRQILKKMWCILNCTNWKAWLGASSIESCKLKNKLTHISVLSWPSEDFIGCSSD